LEGKLGVSRGLQRCGNNDLTNAKSHLVEGKAEDKKNLVNRSKQGTKQGEEASTVDPSRRGGKGAETVGRGPIN